MVADAEGPFEIPTRPDRAPDMRQAPAIALSFPAELPVTIKFGGSLPCENNLARSFFYRHSASSARLLS
jgi:hypothetical protein